MAIFQERTVPGAGVRLWVASARVEGTVRAEVLLTHGLGEHASRYEHVAALLAADGLRLHVYDLRGHGRSEGRRGDAEQYDLLLEDLEQVRRAVTVEGRPWFLMGHSFGGQITLNFLLQRSVDCRGAVVASPLLRLAFAPAWWRLLLGWLAMSIRPGWLQHRAVALEHLSRDAEHVRGLANPELLHDLISARLFFAQRRRGEWALAHAGELRTPLLLLHGEVDQVTSPAATREFFERAGSADKRLLMVPEARHELHNELGRDETLREVAAWMRARSG